ncbi:MAG: outer membrane beta-barrel protein [Gemmatimonadaceae bacterium]
MQTHRVLTRLSLCATVLLVPAHRAVAQRQIGAVVGATFSTLRGIDGLDSRTGLIGGLSLVMGGPLGLQTGLLFVSKGAKGETSGADGLKLNYVEVPLLLRLGLSSGTGASPHIYAGPYLGFKIDCTVEGTDADCDDVPDVSTKTVDIGGVVGGGLDFSFGPLVLTAGLRYGFGVSKVADFEFGSVRESAKNGTFAIYTGLAIKLGG